MTRSRYAWTLAAILGAGALLRLGLALAIPTRPVSDFYGYFVVAENLVRGQGYRTEPGALDGRRSPAYPVLLSLAIRAAPAAGHLLAAKLVNVALFALAGLAAAALARRFWGEAAGLWTAALLAFLPRPILIADLLAAENLVAPLLFAYLLLAADSWIRGFSAGRAAALGLVVGLLVLTRAIFYFVPLVWLAGALASRRPRRALAKELVVILVVAHAVLLPWAVRNARAVGRFTPFNLVGGVGLFIANNPNATGQWYAWPGDLERLRPGTLARGDVAVDDAAREEALRWIRANPGRAARQYLRRLGIILKDDAFAAEFAIFAEEIPYHDRPMAVLPGPHPLKSRPALVKGVLRVAGLLLAAAALGGFVLLWRRARAGLLVDRALVAGFLAAALYVPLVSAAMHVNGRYRWAAEDAIVPLAGLFLASVSTLKVRTAADRTS